MLRLLILCLALIAAVTSESDDESSGDIGGDDEDEPTTAYPAVKPSVPHGNKNRNTNVGMAQGSDGKDGLATKITIATVCVVALAAVAIAAVILIRRRMQNRLQGVYSVPVDQSEKPAI